MKTIGKILVAAAAMGMIAACESMVENTGVETVEVCL